jgi:hypothetical protein
MTMTLLDSAEARPSVSPSQWLRETTAAVRVSFTWFGVRKTLTNEQKNQAAEPFGAEGEFLSARKKILDTKHAAYKEVTAVRGKVLAYWKSLTLPYPEAGIRLIRQHQIDAFNAEMTSLRLDLQDVVARLDEHYSDLKRTAQRRLGELFDANDYPSSLTGLFSVDWDFPNVEPPDYLQQLNPIIFEQEKARVASRFEQAVSLAEQAFLGEFAKLVEHLSERLSGAGGEKKVFRDTAVTNLVEFFERFRQLSVRSNADLDALVDQAQQVVKGVEAQHLRDSDELRRHVTQQLSRVQASIDGMLVDQPRRRIIRNQPSTNGDGHGLGH